MKDLLHHQLTGAVQRRMDPATRRHYAREFELDYTLTPWTRLITSVDASKRGGFCFIGNWIRRGYTDINTLTLPAVALVALERLDLQEHEAYRTYHITVIHSDGYISLTDITTDNREPGWAFRMLPAVSHLLRTLPEYDTNHRPAENGAWSPNRILLTPLKLPAGWYR